jgi:hypothetical protein
MKRVLRFIKDHDLAGIIACALYAFIMVFCIFGCYAQAHADDTLQGKCIVVTQPKKAQPVDTGYTIKVDSVVYKVWRGAKGGCYYIKNGKKVYLTKKQKALIK